VIYTTPQEYEFGVEHYLAGRITLDEFYDRYWPRRPAGPHDERIPRRGPIDYDSASVTLSFGGVEITGFSEGTFVEVAPDPPATFACPPGRSGSITLRLLTEAPSTFPGWTMGLDAGDAARAVYSRWKWMDIPGGGVEVETGDGLKFHADRVAYDGHARRRAIRAARRARRNRRGWA
jgi:hypothetical protein